LQWERSSGDGEDGITWNGTRRMGMHARSTKFRYQNCRKEKWVMEGGGGEGKKKGGRQRDHCYPLTGGVGKGGKNVRCIGRDRKEGGERTGGYSIGGFSS